jgi:hypothetical protein
LTQFINRSKITNVKAQTSLAALLVFAAISLSAHAQTIVDPSFESAYLPNAGDYTGEDHQPANGYGSGPGESNTTQDNPIPGWTVTVAQSGIQNGLVSSLYDGANSGLVGTNFAYNDGTAPFYQVLSGPGSTFEAGTYTLTVAVGTRPDVETAGAVLSLYTASGSSLGTDIKNDDVAGVSSYTGTFTDETLTLTVNSGDSEIGQTIAIALAGGNNKGLDNDDFDNVRLTFDPIPEPSTYAMMLGGALMLGLMVRRRVVRADAL